jgi:hypothetical protein
MFSLASDPRATYYGNGKAIMSELCKLKNRVNHVPEDKNEPTSLENDVSSR